VGGLEVAGVAVIGAVLGLPGLERLLGQPDGLVDPIGLKIGLGESEHA
jgi:hypothetical protein